jgi:CHAT domain-containing protein/tetratricopeptide (TPR) repeat protein
LLSETTWSELSRRNAITPQQSEAAIDTIFRERVLSSSSTSPQEKRVFNVLADSLQQNHHDSWFRDFLNAPSSSKANQFLGSAIRANHDGDVDRAVEQAQAAENLYVRAGNTAGAARSQLELIYAHRRHSHAAACVREISKLKQRIDKHDYTNFRILADFESCNCQTMLGSFDLGWKFAQRTNSEADQGNYPSLKLRALALLSAMDSAEGRFQAAFNGDAAGVEQFWEGFYPAERGFQFYSDAALTAEQAGLWHLAAVLQGEALSMLEKTNRFDFQAMAHYHLAISLHRAGDPIQAQKQFGEAYRLFDRMQDASLRHFLRASSEIDLAEIEIEQGDMVPAQTHLERASTAVEGINNFLVRLSYFNTLANFAHHRNRPAEEWKYLEKTLEIARKGFVNLGSIENRWEWYREVDRSYHRLIELELDVKHDPVQALADWETYRAAEIAPADLVPGNSVNRGRLVSRLKGLRSSTLLSFTVFPERVVIWVADNRGVRVFSTAVDSETLKSEAALFLRLCSDRNSSLEKVNLVGSRLYKRLVQPVKQELAPDRSLAIEADGFLSRIPWPAVVAENGEYLGEQYMTASTPGLFFTAAGRDRKKPVEGRLVAYPGAAEFEGKPYPPLPNAEAEAGFVAQLQPNSVYLRNKQVTASELLRRLPRASSFHFAGHGVSREHGGELLLSGKDQALSASTVRRMDLSGMNLVVLSACSTAEADLDIARGPNGLVQAFLSAGARQVVASRWDVDSRKSLEFMESFASKFVSSNDGQQAIWVARDKVRREAEHPYYWASFDLFGNLN